MPPEQVSAISSRLNRPADTSPVVFSVPPSHFLDRVVFLPTPELVPSNTPNTPELGPSPMTAPLIAPLIAPHSSPALSIAKSLKLASLFWVHPTVRQALKSGEESPPYKKRTRPVSLIVPSRGSMDESIFQRPKAARNCSSPTLVEGRPKGETEQ